MLILKQRLTGGQHSRPDRDLGRFHQFAVVGMKLGCGLLFGCPVGLQCLGGSFSGAFFLGRLMLRFPLVEFPRSQCLGLVF